MAQAPYLLHHPKMMQQMSYPSSRLKHQKTDNSKFVATLFHVYPPAFLRNVVAEIVATFLLVFVTRGAASLRTKDDHKVSPLGASVAGGLIVTVMIYAVGHISGAHMNPAVTLAFAAVGHFLWTQVTSAVATE